MKKTKDNLVKNKGITLIALVITIVILIILASVAITMSLGNRGIFNRTKQAREEYLNSEEYEKELAKKYDNEIGKIVGSRGETVKETTTIKDFVPVLVSKTSTSVNIKANATSEESSEILGYIYLLNDENVKVSEQDEYIFTGLNKATKYKIKVIAVDKNGFKISKELTVETPNKTSSRYIVCEFDDHIADVCLVINEIEVYDGSNKLTYDPIDAFDSSQNGLPYYWNSTAYWMKSNLYDGQIAYGGNSEGGANCLCALIASQSGTSANSGHFCRILLDLGSEKDITNVKIALGGTETRIPKTVNIFLLETSKYSASTSRALLSTKSRDNLNFVGTKTFTETFTTPTWFDFAF